MAVTPKTPELRVSRRYLLRFFLTLPLVLAMYGFFKLQQDQPSWPVPLQEAVQRGAIVSRDGTIFAEGSPYNRSYPQGRLAAHVVGFSGKYQKTDTFEGFGLEGLEFTLEQQLQRGENVIVTLEPRYQAIIQEKLEEYVTYYDAENGSVVALEAGTGRILAAASYPDYDPNHQASVRDRSAISNLAFLNQYEPGSVMKPFVIAALLQNNLISPNSTVESPMTLRVGEQTFRDVVWHESVLSIWDVLRYSSNSGMINLSNLMTSEELRAWLEHFGFGRDVGSPSVFTRNRAIRQTPWFPQDKAAITIGQSLSTTTLQLAAIYSIFANDGYYLTPYIVESSFVPEARQIISAEVARTIRSMLHYSVDKSALHESMAASVSVAGKTGTADIFDASQGRYIPGDYTLTFAGMFPAEQPEIIMVVSIQKPRRADMSTVVTVPLFGDIQKEMVATWQTQLSQPAVASQ